MNDFGFNVRDFIDKYFEDHDPVFMDKLDEVIGSTDDPVEISALADWVFRNYLADAFTEAIEENNKKIYSTVKSMIEKASVEFRRSERAELGERKLKSFPSYVPVELHQDTHGKTGGSIFHSGYTTKKLPDLPSSLRDKLDIDIDLNLDID